MIKRALVVRPVTTRHSPHLRRRAGFTLVEVLVSMVLIMMIMAVLSASFIVGLDTFSKLKALGDMSERLRAAVTLLRTDLDCDHFEGRLRVSDPMKYERPREGFFRVKQFVPSTFEGQSDGVPSYRTGSQNLSGGVGHVLHMAVKKRGSRPEDFFAADPVPALLLKPETTYFKQLVDARHQDAAKGAYRCQWAEVCYYLQELKNANGTSWTANGTKLYSLHRNFRVAVLDNRDVNAQNIQNTKPNRNNYAGLSFHTDPTLSFLLFNSPTDLADPLKRGIDINVQPVLAQETDTMVLTDVVSFDIKLVLAPPIPEPPPAGGQQLKGRFGYPLGEPIVAAAGPPGPFQDIGDYDSATAPIGALMIQITIRIWDLKTQQTRQVTLVQDL